MLRRLTNITAFLFVILFVVAVGACTQAPGPTALPQPTGLVPIEPTPEMTTTPLSEPEPARLLTICLGQEPKSLFLYGDYSAAARSVRQAIYDGPFDVTAYRPQPVILENVPQLDNGGLRFEPVTVAPGSMIVDASGQVSTLKEGIRYLPQGCQSSDCAIEYSGQDPASMDQLVIQYQLKPGISWSDGASLTADDSLFSFEIARALYPRVLPDLLEKTQSYQAINGSTLEWRGIPGFRNASVTAAFFTPLPRHLWGSLPVEELFTSILTSQAPVGWGPYQIDEWLPGDHITLSPNPAYFRAREGFPLFNNLVFRFVPPGEEAVAAFQAGECDVVDDSALPATLLPQLSSLASSGSLSLVVAAGQAWEQAAFGIESFTTGTGESPSPLPIFSSQQVRQAVALCTDRQQMVAALFSGQAAVMDTYVPPEHPLFNPAARRYSFDPPTAIALLEAAGWQDPDGDPSTPRLSAGVTGVPDGSPLQFDLLTTGDPEKQQAAQIASQSLAQCGIRANVVPLPWQELSAGGPEGPVFGRSFQMAQFGWVVSSQPACSLFTTSEIPGPYPEYPRGWGGANASGYSSPDFDATCQAALAAAPWEPGSQSNHLQAQALFAEDLPVLPLYLRPRLVVTRPDLCKNGIDPNAESLLATLELLDYGQNCQN